MSRINVTTVLHVVLHTPVQIVLVVIIRVFPVSIPEIFQAVDVGTLGTDDVTEHAGLSHCQGVHLVIVVAAVLQDEAMLAGLLTHVDQTPALVKVHGARYLDGGMLAVFHGTLSHREMVVPVGSDVNQVDVRALAQFLVTLFTAVDGSWLQALLAQEFLRFLCAFLLIVAESHDFNPRDMAESHHRPWSTHTKPHESHAHGLQLWSPESQYVLLSGRTFWSFHYDSTLVPMPLGIRRQRLCACCKRECSQRRNQKAFDFHFFHLATLLVRICLGIPVGL